MALIDKTTSPSSDPNSPAYEIAAFTEMAERWEIVRDVVKGSWHLCGGDVATNYLLPFPAESDDVYNTRRSFAQHYDFNVTARTLGALVGMVFRNDPQLADDNPAQIVDHWENIDNAGNHGAVWAKETFTHQLEDGHCFIYVDMPPALPDGATFADEQLVERRPYWIRYTADQAINWRFDISLGWPRLAQITFKEVTEEPMGEYGEEIVTRYRVLRPGAWALYREATDEKQNTTVELEAEGVTGLAEIPVSVAYGRRKGLFKSEPMLFSIALLNLAYLNKYSDHSTGLHYTIPFLGTIGKAEDIRSIGYQTVMEAPVGGDIKYVESNGSGLEPQRMDLADIRDLMASLGVSLLAEKTGQRTATEEVFNHVKEESDLATAARSLKDALEQALMYHAAYLNLEAGSVELGATLDQLTLDADKMRILYEMTQGQSPVLPIEAVQDLLIRAGELPEDFDKAEAMRQIEARQADIGAQLERQFNAGLERPVA